MKNRPLFGILPRFPIPLACLAILTQSVSVTLHAEDPIEGTWHLSSFHFEGSCQLVMVIAETTIVNDAVDTTVIIPNDSNSITFETNGEYTSLIDPVMFQVAMDSTLMWSLPEDLKDHDLPIERYHKYVADTGSWAAAGDEYYLTSNVTSRHDTARVTDSTIRIRSHAKKENFVFTSNFLSYDVMLTYTGTRAATSADGNVQRVRLRSKPAPMPAMKSDMLLVSYPGEEEFAGRLMDIRGRVLLRFQGRGPSRLSLPAKGLAAGHYLFGMSTAAGETRHGLCLPVHP